MSTIRLPGIRNHICIAFLGDSFVLGIWGVNGNIPNPGSILTYSYFGTGFVSILTVF
jgi:hypothetical protein